MLTIFAQPSQKGIKWTKARLQLRFYCPSNVHTMLVFMIINGCHVAVGVEFLVTKLEYLLFDELKYIQYEYITFS